MNNTTLISSSLVTILPIIQRYLTILMIILLYIGIFGNLINCFIFFQAKHRKNACSIFCAGTSVVNIFILIQAIVGIILALVLPTDPENFNYFYCKTRLYIRHALVMINRTCTIFSCASCFALSSEQTKFRLLINRISLSYYLLLFSSCFWFIFCSHVAFFTTLDNNKCIMIGNYTLIFSIYMLILAGSISPILMILFSLLTLKNLKNLHQRIRPINNPRRFRLHKRDFQLIRMLLIHVIVYLISTVLYPINLVYIAITKYDTHESLERITIENFTTFLTNNFLFYLNNVAPFFTYYCTSSSFRKEVKNLWIKCRYRQRNLR